MQGTIHIDKALTQVSVSYSQSEFISERVFLPLPVEKQSDKYYKYGKEQFRKRNDLRSPGTEAQSSNWTLTNDRYACDGHALKDNCPREQQTNQDPALDLLVDTTQVLTEQVGLNQEAALIDQLRAGVTNQVDLKNTPFTSGDFDVIAYMRERCDVVGARTGKRPNVWAMGAREWTAVQNNPSIVGKITGAQSLAAAHIQPAMVAALLEIDEVLVGRATYLTSAEGQADVMDYVWKDLALLFYRPPSPGRKTIALGYTMQWKNAVGSMDSAISGVPGNGSQFVETYYWQPFKADVVEVHKYYDQKIVAADAGELYLNVRG